jgi:hypothetical protein
MSEAGKRQSIGKAEAQEKTGLPCHPLRQMMKNPFL